MINTKELLKKGRSWIAQRIKRLQNLQVLQLQSSPRQLLILLLKEQAEVLFLMTFECSLTVYSRCSTML